jgi:hypothetical protein
VKRGNVPRPTQSKPRLKSGRQGVEVCVGIAPDGWLHRAYITPDRVLSLVLSKPVFQSNDEEE